MNAPTLATAQQHKQSGIRNLHEKHDTIVDAITAVTRKSPLATALKHDNSSCTYAQLETYSDQIAARLIEVNIQKGDGVALCLDRSIQAIAAMLGVFKAGAFFVPLDPTFPPDRVAYTIEDAGIRALLCSTANQSDFQFTDLPVVLPGDIPVTTQKALTDLPLPDADDRAYVMYTSGSTGKPKGVAISHGALFNYCIADASIFKLQAKDRTLQFSTLAFDIAIEEIFPPLMVGSTVVVRPSERSNAQIELSDIVEKYSITALHLATGYWHEWVDLMSAANVKVSPDIRLMVVTGEKVSPEHYQRWQSLVSEPVLWANAYGPTETTVSATVFIPPPGWHGKSMPIGKPLHNYTAYILDENGRQLGTNETGELFIGGSSLAEGYLNKPDLTDDVFVSDPFSTSQGARMYRTGDLARWLPDGNIEYAGRIDHQLKVGSYRIEPGEIENAINEHEQVKEALVVADEINNKKLLLAYIASDYEHLTASTLSSFLQTNLPRYMIPARYVLMKNLPKTLNGKIDRKALPDGSNAVLPQNCDYIAPVGDIQKNLCHIWSEILGIPLVGTSDSFVSLGGDSLLAVKTISRIQSDLSFTISTRDFFYLDTVALLAGYIEGKAVSRIVPAPDTRYITKKGRQIYTVLQPADQESNKHIGVLLVPPLGNENRRAQRPLRILTQNLARLGFTSLRFDWTGTGNSSGLSEDIDSATQWADDIRDAAIQLAKQCNQINIVAIRAGAFIAAQAELQELPVQRRYYWDPILSAKQWLDEMATLQTGILNDAYRFLRKRNHATGVPNEFAGLILNEKLQSSLSSQTMVQLLCEHTWNSDAHLLLTDPITARYFDSVPCQTHRVDEKNAWTHVRETTTDMKINRASGKLVELLSGDLHSGDLHSSYLRLGDLHSEDLPPEDLLSVESTKGHNPAERMPLDSRVDTNPAESASTELHFPMEVALGFGGSTRLASVYTPPEKQDECQLCVLYLTAGLLHHVGPTRLHVEMSRALSRQNIAGLRFDLSGVGDSETSTLGGYFTERSVSEIKGAMDFIQSKHGHNRFILLGLCSGADDALATAQEDNRVSGVVLLNGYAYKTGKYPLYLLKELYLPRLFMWEKWKNKLNRLVGVNSNLSSHENNAHSETMTSNERHAIAKLDEDYRYIPPKSHTGKIIDKLTEAGVNLYFIYSGSEYEVYTYEGQLLDMFPAQRNNQRLKESYIKEADHTFILKEDRDKLISWITDWFRDTSFDRRDR